MALGDSGVLLAGLLRMDLPGRTVRLADGGLAVWGADRFEGADDVFGHIQDVRIDREGVGDLAPGGVLVMAVPGSSAAADVSNPAMQGSRIRMWLAEINKATGAVTGTPDLLFDGIVDVPRLGPDGKGRVLEIEFVSQAEVLFLRNQGNVLNKRHHVTMWSGEQGLDNANGVSIKVAWGAKAPPEASNAGSASLGGFNVGLR